MLTQVTKTKIKRCGITRREDALAALEYTFAAMESHELGGALVRPHSLPPEA